MTGANDEKSTERKPRVSRVYTLVYSAGGETTKSTATTSLAVARQEYAAALRGGGVSPRLYVDGEKKTIREADRLMNVDKWSQIFIPVTGKKRVQNRKQGAKSHEDSGHA